MIWTLLLPLLWKGTLTGAALANDRTSNQILTPLPSNAGRDLVNFVSRRVNVDLGFLRADDVVHKKKTLCGKKAEEFRNSAVPLAAKGVSACAKETAAQELKSFYVDDEDNCFGSDMVVEGEGTCSEKLVVYSLQTPPVNCDDDPIPDVRNLVVGDFSEDMSSLVATFEPVCPGAFFYELQIDGYMLDDVAKSGRRVPAYGRVRPCTEYSRFALQPYHDDVEGFYVGDPIFAPPVTTPGDCSRIDETEQDFGN